MIFRPVFYSIKIWFCWPKNSKNFVTFPWTWFHHGDLGLGSLSLDRNRIKLDNKLGLSHFEKLPLSYKGLNKVRLNLNCGIRTFMALNDQFTPILVSRRLFVMNFFKPWQSTKSQGSPDGSTRDRKIGTLGLKRKMGQKWNEPFDLIDKSESDSIPNGKIVQFAIRSITSPTILSRLNKTYDFWRVNMINKSFRCLILEDLGHRPWGQTNNSRPPFYIPFLYSRNFIGRLPRYFSSDGSFFGSDISYHRWRGRWIIEIQIGRIQDYWIWSRPNCRFGLGQWLGQGYFCLFKCSNGHVCFFKFNSKKIMKKHENRAS